MKTLSNISLIIILALVFLSSCGGPNTNQQTSSFEDSISNQILEIKFPGNTLESVNAIISRSGIQHDGYGLLLIMNQSIPQTQADSIRWFFQKKDINAVHLFNISENDSLNPVLQSAIKNSRFIWLFADKAKKDKVNRIISAIEKTASEGILVVDDDLLTP